MEKRVVYHPKSVHVRISSGCNLACTFCEREMLPKAPSGRKKRAVIEFTDGRRPLDLSQDMSEHIWRLVAERLMPHVWRMELGGLGEPTLGKLFPLAAKEIVGAGRDLFFFTNGHYLGSKRVLDAVGERPEVSVSIDAGTAEAYRRVRGGELGELVKSVQAFRAAKPRARLFSQFTATSDNIDELPAWVELCAKLGIGRFDQCEEIVMVGAHHHVTDRAEKSIRFFEDRTLRNIDRARVIAEKEGLWFMAHRPASDPATANAGEDGSDPTGIRRYSDRLYGDTQCITEPIGSMRAEAGAVRTYTPLPPPAGEEFRVVGRELYVDVTGEVWTCLARHRVGHVEDAGWRELVETNHEYQHFLESYALGQPRRNATTCRACVNRQ